MRKQILYALALTITISVFNLSCKKSANPVNPDKISAADKPYNLNVVLRGTGTQSGYLKFRQDPATPKIITLEIKVENLIANHEYLLRRAVDAVNVVDGNCTSTTWLTLGRGLTPQTILTNSSGTGNELLWRDVSAIASGSAFDIHFQVVDATNMTAILTGDCYQYTVR